MQWSEGLSDSVSIIIRRYIDHMTFAAFVAVWFIIFFVYHFVYGPIFCRFMFDFVNCVSLLLCILIFML